jgi:hypothetical protein
MLVPRADLGMKQQELSFNVSGDAKWYTKLKDSLTVLTKHTLKREYSKSTP